MKKYIGVLENICAYFDEDKVLIKSIYSDSVQIVGIHIAAILWLIKEYEEVEEVIKNISYLFNCSYEEADKLLNQIVEEFKDYIGTSDQHFVKGEILIDIEEIKKCKSLKDLEKKIEYPAEIALYVTKNCNRKCLYCKERAFYNKQIESNNYFSNLQNINDLAEQSGDKVKIWTLTGGEPFLHPNIIEILRCLRKNSSGEISIVTKGVTNLELLNKICEDKLVDNISFSLDSTQESVVTLLTGSSETYRDIYGNIELVKKHRIEININTVLTSINYNHMEQIAEFAFKNNIKKVTFNSAAKEGRCKDDLRLDTNQLEFCKDKINELAKKYSPTLMTVLKIKNGCDKCHHVYERLLLKSDGSLETCNGKIIGSMDEGSILELWKRAEIKN